MQFKFYLYYEFTSVDWAIQQKAKRLSEAPMRHLIEQKVPVYQFPILPFSSPHFLLQIYTTLVHLPKGIRTNAIRGFINVVIFCFTYARQIYQKQGSNYYLFT